MYRAAEEWKEDRYIDVFSIDTIWVVLRFQSFYFLSALSFPLWFSNSLNRLEF